MKRSGFTLVNVIINLSLIWASIATNSERSPLYSLVTDLKPLLEIQSLVIDVLPKIIAEKKSTWSFLKREVMRFQTVHKKAMEGASNSLKNHVNRYTLFKRLSRDFSCIKNQIERHTYTSLNRNRSLRYPSYMDLDEAGRMVQRLQRVYRINVTKLADGLLESAYSGTGETYRETFLPMTASDCFELSKVIYENKFYRSGVSWLLEARRLFARDKPKLGLNKNEIVFISNSYNKLNTAKQLEWAKKLKPKFDEEKIRDIQFRNDIKRSHFNRKNLKGQNEQLNRKLENPDVWEDKHRDKEEAEERKVFRKLCRGEQFVARDVKKRLKCWYFPGHHPFSRLARFRAEQLFVRPEVLLVHNAVSDAEMHTIIHIAQPKINAIPVAEVKARQNFVNYVYCPCKGTWFDEDDSRYIESVTQRISDITGCITTSTRIVVTNYGVGGHYIPHLDSSDIINDDNTDFSIATRDKSELRNTARIATALLYLSDVEQGGFTAFPRLGLAVPPQKGAALLWMNVLPTGKADPLLIHGGCPVLRGSKWVASKWINATGQELKKPCTKKNTSSLTYSNEKQISVSNIKKKHK